MSVKLDTHHRHILRLIKRDRNDSGWATVSEALYKPLVSSMPYELVVFEKLEKGGRARLTDLGEKVLDAMAWL